MNIAVLSRGETLYSTQSLLKAGEALNHSIEVIDPTYCNVFIEDDKALLQYHDKLIDDLDAIIPRIGASNTYYGTSLVRHFEAMEVFSVVSSEGIRISRDKWASFQIMAKAGVPLPKTTLVSQYYAEDFLRDFGQGPVIIKLLEGTHGTGVILCESYKNALATLETLRSTRSRFLLQEYIEESKGADLRVIVVGGSIVASMRRQAKEGDFRSNLHRGGSSEAIKLSEAEKNAALRAAKSLNLGVCGVDILQSKRGPLVLEVNSTPGLEGVENTTGIDVSKHIIEYLERHKR